jgi:hypothetical protein
MAGAMTLTIYSAHAFVLRAPMAEDHPLALYLLLVAGALVFAVLWNRWMGQGPLERLVGIPADRARQAVLAGRFPARTGPSRRGDATQHTAAPAPRGPVDAPEEHDAPARQPAD